MESRSTTTGSDRSPVWVLPPEPDPAAVSGLCAAEGLHEAVAQIILRRLERKPTDEEIRRYLRPRFDHLHDPYLLDGMSEATKRLADAVYAREPVVIFGDYDVDGTTATALLAEALQRLGVPVEWRIPHRTTDGYGLTDRGVELVCASQGSLVILVDCGITATDQIARLKAAGRDVIVVDHHEPGPELPDALALLDPKLPGSRYPFDGLAAVGVAFKLLQALCDALGLPPDELLLPGMDLVAVGTAADIVPIRDENRVLMRLGLRVLQRNARRGLRALIKTAGLAGVRLTTSSIVFGLAPRINAAGRVRSADTAVRLLLTEDEREARALASELDQNNRERQQMDQRTLEEARELAEGYVAAGAQALVLADPDWHPGVVGIAAARIVEGFGLPAVLISLQEPVGKGSGRSVYGFDLYSALAECADDLVSFGGHSMAAGVNIRPDQVDAFRRRFNDVAAARLTDDMVRPRLELDAEVALADVTADLLRQIELLGPFGPENMRPVLVSRGVRAASPPQVLKEKHLKLRVAAGEAVRDAIAFDQADAKPLCAGRVDIAYVAEENRWQGQTRLQLRIKAIRAAE